MPGEYVKYNNNQMYVHEVNDPINQAAQAFSHFTFERSWGRFLVCDLQGVGRLLTDPGIHTQDPNRFKLSDTNLNSDGFKFFFCTHKCNDICRRLELKSDGHMLVSGNLEFREWWPTIDSTVCCSNKLCGRIIQVVNSQRSDEFPGHQWCSVCWSQLSASKVTRTCAKQGQPFHQFAASAFFHESQGESLPLICPDHRDKSTTLYRNPLTGSKIWESVKSQNKTTSLSGQNW